MSNKSYGLIDSSSLLKNSFRQDTSTGDKITEIDDEVAELKAEVITLQLKINQLINLINNLNTDSPSI